MVLWWWFETNPNHHCESWGRPSSPSSFFFFYLFTSSYSHQKKIESHNCPAYTHNYYFVTKLPLTHHHSHDAIPIIIQNQNIKSLPLTGRLPCLHMHDCCVRWEKAVCVRLSLLFFSPLSFFLALCICLLCL